MEPFFHVKHIVCSYSVGMLLWKARREALEDVELNPENTEIPSGKLT